MTVELCATQRGKEVGVYYNNTLKEVVQGRKYNIGRRIQSIKPPKLSTRDADTMCVSQGSLRPNRMVSSNK